MITSETVLERALTRAPDRRLAGGRLGQPVAYEPREGGHELLALARRQRCEHVAGE